MTRTRLAWCFLLASSVAACSVVSGLDDFKISGNSESNGSGTGGASTGGAPGAGGTAGDTTSSGPSAGGGGDSSTSSGGGTTTTTTTTTVAQVPCANSLCPTGEVCCHNGNSPNQDHCAAPGGCGADSEMACAGPLNCAPGTECCADRDFYGYWEYSTCRVNCMANEDLLCGGDPSVCPQGWNCDPSEHIGAGYAYCLP